MKSRTQHGPSFRNPLFTQPLVVKVFPSHPQYVLTFLVAGSASPIHTAMRLNGHRDALFTLARRAHGQPNAADGLRQRERDVVCGATAGRVSLSDGECVREDDQRAQRERSDCLHAARWRQHRQCPDERARLGPRHARRCGRRPCDSGRTTIPFPGPATMGRIPSWPKACGCHGNGSPEITTSSSKGISCNATTRPRRSAAARTTARAGTTEASKGRSTAVSSSFPIRAAPSSRSVPFSRRRSDTPTVMALDPPRSLRGARRTPSTSKAAPPRGCPRHGVCERRVGRRALAERGGLGDQAAPRQGEGRRKVGHPRLASRELCPRQRLRPSAV